MSVTVNGIEVQAAFDPTSSISLIQLPVVHTLGLNTSGGFTQGFPHLASGGSACLDVLIMDDLLCKLVVGTDVRALDPHFARDLPLIAHFQRSGAYFLMCTF
jgi:hypothetical protein